MQAIVGVALVARNQCVGGTGDGGRCHGGTGFLPVKASVFDGGLPRRAAIWQPQQTGIADKLQ